MAKNKEIKIPTYDEGVGESEVLDLVKKPDLSNSPSYDESISEEYKLPSEEISTTEAAARKLGQGLTYNHMDELGAALSSGGKLLKGDISLDELTNKYKELRDYQRERDQLAQEQHPYISTAAELTGGVMSPITKVLGTAGKGVGILPKNPQLLDKLLSIGKKTLVGAALGGTAASIAGEGASEKEDLSGILEDARKYGEKGMILGAAIPLAVGTAGLGLEAAGKLAKPLTKFRSIERIAKGYEKGKEGIDLSLPKQSTELAAQAEELGSVNIPEKTANIITPKQITQDKMVNIPGEGLVLQKVIKSIPQPQPELVQSPFAGQILPNGTLKPEFLNKLQNMIVDQAKITKQSPVAEKKLNLLFEQLRNAGVDEGELESLRKLTNEAGENYLLASEMAGGSGPGVTPTNPTSLISGLLGGISRGSGRLANIAGLQTRNIGPSLPSTQSVSSKLIAAGAALQEPEEISKEAYHISPENLNLVANDLKNDPGLSVYGEGLEKALMENNEQSKNALIFSLLQRKEGRDVIKKYIK